MEKTNNFLNNQRYIGSDKLKRKLYIYNNTNNFLVLLIFIIITPIIIFILGSDILSNIKGFIFETISFLLFIYFIIFIFGIPIFGPIIITLFILRFSNEKIFSFWISYYIFKYFIDFKKYDIILNKSIFFNDSLISKKKIINFEIIKK